MLRRLRWHEFITLNAHWLGLSTATGCITPVLLPYLVALFVAPGQKNTYLATVRVTSLAVAMMIQPMAGLLSDRNRARWGRRRPYIVGGTLASIVFLLPLGASTLFAHSVPSGSVGSPGLSTAYLVLLTGVVLWQGAANVGQGALQGLIPDLVPEDQRGRASGVKAVMELLAALPIILIGPIVDSGRIWLALGLVAVALGMPMLLTVVCVRETPLKAPPPAALGRHLVRLAGLTLVFVAVTRLAAVLVRAGSGALLHTDWAVGLRAAAAGVTGLAGMTGAICLGVWLGVRAGIGGEGHDRRGFMWWVVNRLMFLAAIGSIQGFVLYYLRDVHGVADAATMTSRLSAVLAGFLIPSALAGGYLADRLGRKRLVAWAGLVAAMGALLLAKAPNLAVVYAAAAVLGTATGTFMATNWALGADLVPPTEAGRYLGVSNLAGAGAGIVGAGIGGPLADTVNALHWGWGYVTIFGAYAVLFLLSILAVRRVDRR